MAGANYSNIGGGWHKNSKIYDNIGGTWHQTKKIYNNIGGIWHQSFASDVSYTSTLSFMDYGSAMDNTYFSFYVSGSSRGFYSTITFDEAIPITSFYFGLSRQDANIDVYFSGYMRLMDINASTISNGTTQAYATASTSKSSGCSSGAINNPSPATLVKYVEIHASGKVSELYFNPVIVVNGVGCNLLRYGIIAL